MTYSLVWLLCICLITACSSRDAVSPAPPPARSETIGPTVHPSRSTPGLLVQGHVLLSDGKGLANVTICRNFATYPGSIVARTDPTGYYQGAFVDIPGDETIGVWVQQAGYSFRPKLVSWRH